MTVRKRIWDGSTWAPYGGNITPEPEPEPDPIPVASRNPGVLPWQSSSFWNTSIGDGAAYADTEEAQTLAFMTPEYGAVTTNTVTYTLAYWKASASDPTVTFELENNDQVLQETFYLKAPYSQPLSGEVDIAGLNPDSVMGLLEVDGFTYHEFYKTKKMGGNRLRVRRHLVYDLRTSLGWPSIAGTENQGIRAACWPWRAGLITSEEVSFNGDPKEAIPHVLAMAFDLTQFVKPANDLHINPATGQQYKSAKRPPALGIDSAGPTAYTGTFERGLTMGSLFAIPREIDLTTLGLTTEQLKLAYCLQNYGVRVADASKYPTIYFQLGANASRAADMRAAWISKLWKLMRRVTNDAPANYGGPGNRLRPRLTDNFVY